MKLLLLFMLILSTLAIQRRNHRRGSEPTNNKSETEIQKEKLESIINIIEKYLKKHKLVKADLKKPEVINPIFNNIRKYLYFVNPIFLEILSSKEPEIRDLLTMLVEKNKKVKELLDKFIKLKDLYHIQNIDEKDSAAEKYAVEQLTDDERDLLNWLNERNENRRNDEI